MNPTRSLLDLITEAMAAAERAGLSRWAALEYAATVVMCTDQGVSLGAARCIVASLLPTLTA